MSDDAIRRVLLVSQDPDFVGFQGPGGYPHQDWVVASTLDGSHADLVRGGCQVLVLDGRLGPQLIPWLSEQVKTIELPPIVWVANKPLVSGEIGTAPCEWIRDLSDPTEVAFRLEQLRKHSRLFLELSRLQYLADHDALTGLPNRRHFFERLDRCVFAAQCENFAVALLFIDLDGFKAVNDSLGHDAGDQLLSTIAERITAHVRPSDTLKLPKASDPATVSRLGGDEFALLLNQVTGPEGAQAVAERIARLISEPIEIDGHEITVSASIGISLLPGDAVNTDELLSHADQAMYHAKQRGPNNFAFYDHGMDSASLRRLTVAARLRKCIEMEELQVAYQPRIWGNSGEICGAEVLARWTDGDLGVVRPDEFIPIAESTGLILPLGRRVLELACSQIRSWRESGHRDVHLSVNVSPQQFAREDLVGAITDTMTKYQVEPSCLELEITENLFLAKTQRVTETLTQLREMGIRIALDDFGTGYSSLSFILQFPIDTLKIDRCLIENIPDDSDAAGVVRAMIEMARSMDIGIVAEGVDDERQKTWLIEHGCHELQGFACSGPLPAKEYEMMLGKRKGHAS